MTEKQILGSKPAPRLEQVGNEHSERMEDRKHRFNDAMILAYDANLGRMEFSERTGPPLNSGIIVFLLSASLVGDFASQQTLQTKTSVLPAMNSGCQAVTHALTPTVRGGSLPTPQLLRPKTIML